MSAGSGERRRAQAPAQSLSLVLTCEHASAAVPGRYRTALAGAKHLLHTHRASDPGALELARRLARATGAPLLVGTATRLLIDLNRSEDRAELWSPWSAALPAAERRRLIEQRHRPFRDATRAAIDGRLAGQPGCAVLHVSVHSFTPLRRGQRRSMHVALLFDPARPLEARLARRWRRALQRREPRLEIAFNRPYRGTDDGHTTALRHRYPPTRYAGLELEINQLFPRRGGPRWQRLQAHLQTSLQELLGNS